MPQIFLLTGTTTWTVPDDCVSVNVDTIGAGSGGSTLGGAGAGGAWSGIIALAVAPKSTITVQIGSGGVPGSVGGDTWFNGASLGAASVGAKGGGAPATTTGGTGGQASGRPNSGNTTGNNGGNGGSLSTDAGGGGGAGGPNGAGNNGSNGGVGSGGNGGQGDGSSGGTGGAGGTTGTAGSGNPGTEYDGTHGSGGGGGGCTTGTAGTGGNYGGGGGACTAGGTGGPGANGLIVINYVSVFVNKRVPAAPWNVGSDEPSGWQFAAQYNASLATSVLPKKVLRPPFYAPRPSDDFVWSLTLDNRNANILIDLSAQKFFGVGGQVPTKRWNNLYDYDDSAFNWRGPDDWYSSVPITLLTEQKFFGAPGQAPTKRWEPYYDYDSGEASVWYPTADNRNANPLNLLAHVKFFGAPGQAPTKFWGPYYNYDVDEALPWRGPLDSYSSAVIPLLTAVKFFGAMGQAPTKRWNLYYNYNVAESDWQQSNWMGTATFYTLLNGPKTPFEVQTWKFGYSDDSFWLGQPTNANSINLPITLPQATFYAPRPSDDFVWSPTPDNRNSNTLNILIVGGQVKPRLIWGNTQDDSSGWSFGPVSSRTLTPSLGQIKFQREWLFGYDDPAFRSDLGPQSSALLHPLLTVGGQVTQSHWAYTVDDLPAWVQAPNNNLGLAASASAAKNVLRPPFVVPRPSDDTHWQFYSKGRNLAITIVPSNNPFTYIPWKFGYDDPSDWQQKSPFNLNTAASIQFPPELDWTYSAPDDLPAWQPILDRKNPNLTPGSVIEPFIYTPWQFNYDDASSWQGVPLASDLLVPLLTAVGQVKWKREWLFSYDDPAFRSDLGPQASLLLHPILTAGGQVHNKQWLFGYDDPSYWVGAPRVSQQPVLALQPPPVQFQREWLFGYDDPAYWQGRPTSSEILVPILTAVGQVKWQREWLFGYDDSAFWVSLLLNSQPSRILTPSLGQIKFQREWLFGYDDPSYWGGALLGPQPSRILTPSLGQIKLQREWLFGYDDPAFRSDLGPQSSKILVPILTAAGQVKSKPFRFGYDDPPFWMPILGRQQQLLAQGRINPFIPPYPTFTYEDPAFWQYGYYARSNFPLLIYPLIVDYNYICSPNALLPSNAGAMRVFAVSPVSRTFVTSPNAPLPSNTGASGTFVVSPLTPNPLKKF